MSKKRDRKPFRETKVGSWLREKFPDVLEAAGDVTGIEAFDVVARLINGKDMSDEERIEWARLRAEHEEEILRLEVENTKSAREREASVVQALGKPDYAQWVVGALGLLLAGAVIYKGLFGDIDDREIYFHLLGVVEGAVLLTIFNYYFGSSSGSRDKNKLLSK